VRKPEGKDNMADPNIHGRTDNIKTDLTETRIEGVNLGEGKVDRLL
jgi:hypothetical protein